MDFTSSNAFITVPSYFYPPEDAKTIHYKIHIQFGSQTWELSKRYSHFDKLNDELKTLLGSSIPQLPKKTFVSWFRDKTEEEIDERRQGLDYYLKELVARIDILNSEPLRKFLEIDKHATETAVIPPTLHLEFKDFYHGIRDLVIDYTSNYMIVVGAEMNVLSRVDAYVANMKMPWEQEVNSFSNSTHIPVGSIELWQLQENLEFEKKQVKMFTSQSICLTWEPITGSIFIGLDNGVAHSIKVIKDELGAPIFTDCMDIELHFERIMGLYFDHKRNLLHSVAKDRRYRVVDLKTSGLRAGKGNNNKCKIKRL